MRVSEATSAYLLQLQGDGRSIHTVRQAARFLRKFAAELHDPPVDQLRHEDIARFLASPAVATKAGGGARKANSANAIRSVLRSFCSFLHGAGYCPTNVARLVRRARCAPPRPRALSEAEAARLIATLDTARTPAELRDRAMFRVMLGVGLRVGSVIGLDVADVDLAEATLRVRTLKGRDEDTVFLSPELVELLRAYIATVPNGPLFPGIDGSRLGSRQVGRRLELWSERAEIGRRVNPHALRHSFALAMYSKTHDVLLVGRLLCHRSVASTATYARPSEARAREAVAR